MFHRTETVPGIATATTAGLVAGMTAARFVVGPLTRRVTAVRLLVTSFVVAVGGWAVVWSAGTTGAALAGLVVAGCGYGAQYPLAIALLLDAAPDDRDRAQARATLAGALAVAAAPFALGALADAFGTHRAFLVVPVLAVVGGLAAWVGSGADVGGRSGAAPSR